MHTHVLVVLCDVCSTGIEGIQSCKCSNMTISVTIIFLGFHYDTSILKAHSQL